MAAVICTEWNSEIEKKNEEAGMRRCEEWDGESICFETICPSKGRKPETCGLEFLNCPTKPEFQIDTKVNESYKIDEAIIRYLIIVAYLLHLVGKSCNRYIEHLCQYEYC